MPSLFLSVVLLVLATLIPPSQLSQVIIGHEIVKFSDYLLHPFPSVWVSILPIGILSSAESSIIDWRGGGGGGGGDVESHIGPAMNCSGAT